MKNANRCPHVITTDHQSACDISTGVCYGLPCGIFTAWCRKMRKAEAEEGVKKVTVEELTEKGRTT